MKHLNLSRISEFVTRLAWYEGLLGGDSVYLEDILRRALAGETDWAALVPRAWKAEHSESIREYRQDERRQAADRKWF